MDNVTWWRVERERVREKNNPLRIVKIATEWIK